MYKMNEIISKFLLGGDITVPEIHLSQPAFTYSGCRSFTKKSKWTNKKESKKQAGDSRYIYQNESDQDCLQPDMAYESFEDLQRRTVFDKVWRIKAFKIAKTLKYYGYQCGLIEDE